LSGSGGFNIGTRGVITVATHPLVPINSSLLRGYSDVWL
jgi:hypothetical protein